jgi:hypothetical protein
MKPAEFVRFAESILNRPAAVPAALRSVTSRAYYGAFHLACEYLVSLSISAERNHKVNMWLIQCTHPSARRLGNALGELQTSRIKADYRLDQPAAETPDSARRSIELAQEVEMLLTELGAEDIRDQIRQELGDLLARQRPT